jgi:DNA-binding NarL/FixJ family response regulator
VIPSAALRVAIRSERRLFRDALAACLADEPRLSVVGHVAESSDLVTLYDLCHPHVIVFDLGSEVAEGLRELQKVREACAGSRLVVVYDRLSPADLALAWQFGADTVVPASHGLGALVLVLLKAEPPATDRTHAGDTGEGLTDREREIITLVGAGHTANRIAELLHVSPNAVENHKRRIYHKLDVTGQCQAVARAASLGIVDRLAEPATAPEQLDDEPDDAAPARTEPRIRDPESPGAILAVVRGRDGPSRDAVAATLLQQRIAFVSETAAYQSTTPDGLLPWERWQSGPAALVLIEPAPDDWPEDGDAVLATVLVLPVNSHRADALDGVRRGASAVVRGEYITQDLVPVLTLALRGYLTFDAADARTLFAGLRDADQGSGLPDLTARECDILRSIAAGHTVRQTARSLGIAAKTVENTQARLFRKLRARNRAGALAAAHSLGLLALLEDA